MKSDHFYAAGSVALCLAWLFSPAGASAKDDFNLSFQGNAEHCSELKVTSNGQIARGEETFTLQRSQTPALEIDDAAGHAVMSVRGWDQPQYSVEVCKIAVAADRAAADQLLRGVGVTRSGSHFSTTGPGGDGAWQTYFIVHAPKDGSLDLQIKNGPIAVADITGVVKARATNGPISLKDCGGQVDATTTNGPISFSGKGGEVHLRAQNGPISVSLAEDVWNGPSLEARAVNGPVSLSIPETFRSGVRVETSHGPMSCGIAPCKTAWKDPQRSLMQLNNSADTIKISTENGPVSIGSKKIGKVI
jgi:hypothetical protein